MVRTRKQREAAPTPDKAKEPEEAPKQKTAYEIASCLVGSEMCIRDSTCWARLQRNGSSWLCCAGLFDVFRYEL